MRVSRFAAALGVAVAVVLGGAASAGAVTPDVARAQGTHATYKDHGHRGHHGRHHHRGYGHRHHHYGNRHYR
ncbi:hypothetical protein ACFXJ5_31435 [Streptomyces sp. NPDC059373]